jgi:YjbE family integral membrane protein
VDLQALAVGAAVSDQFFDALTSMFGSYGPMAVSIAKIIGINIILSGDNAVVIALACRGLPPKQRMYGILLGAGAAIVLRIIFTVIVNQLLGIPYLRLVGGLLLFWIAVKLVIHEEASEDSVGSGSNLWEAVKIVAIADIVMSLDNVLAIAGAAESADPELRIWLIVMGLVISIPLVVAGSTLIMSLLSRYPALVWAGAALLGWVAGELIATEPVLQETMTNLAQSLSISSKVLLRSFEVGGAAIVLGLGWVLTRKTASATSH